MQRHANYIGNICWIYSTFVTLDENQVRLRPIYIGEPIVVDDLTVSKSKLELIFTAALQRERDRLYAMLFSLYDVTGRLFSSIEDVPVLFDDVLLLPPEKHDKPYSKLNTYMTDLMKSSENIVS